MDNILLVDFLRHSGNKELIQLDLKNYDWSTLIRQARRSNLLSRLAVFLIDENLIDKLPEKPRQHFLNSIFLSKGNARSALWEVIESQKIFKEKNISFILLKGCAYIQLQNDAAKGRLFSDTDILVKKEQLTQVEKLLAYAGWFTTKLSAYDQKFYRNWMHEIPPLQNLRRHSALDVHHSIIPPISAIKLDINKLWERAVPVNGMDNVLVLSPTDMILHSATHLFHEGEFEQGLRDISDLDLLLRQYVLEDNLWDTLLNRSLELNVELPLYYALTYCEKILQTPIPAEVLEQTGKNAKFNFISKKIMDSLFLRALIPEHATYHIYGAGFTRWVLFIRSHWIKMPVHILVPHLIRKSWLSFKGEK